MNLWPVEHIFERKSDDKYAQKSVQLVRGSSFRSDFLQNPYFNVHSILILFQKLFRHFTGRTNCYSDQGKRLQIWSWTIEQFVWKVKSQNSFWKSIKVSETNLNTLTNLVS